MKKTFVICLTVAVIAVFASVVSCIVTAPSPTDYGFSPATGDLNFLIVVPIMIIAALLIFIIIKRRKE